MVSWFNREEKFPNEIFNVPVKELGLYDEINGEEVLVETIAVCDLTNDEYVKLQHDPFLSDYPGSLSDKSSPKNQAYTMLITWWRMKKAHEKLGVAFALTPNKMMKWSITRSGDLAIAIKEHLESVAKKSKSSQGQESSKQSGTPANTQT